MCKIQECFIAIQHLPPWTKTSRRCQGEGARQSRALHGTRTGDKLCHFKIPLRLDGDFSHKDSQTVAKAAHIVQSLNLRAFKPQLDQPVLTQQLTPLWAGGWTRIAWSLFQCERIYDSTMSYGASGHSDIKVFQPFICF